MTGIIKGRDALELMYFHLKKCARPGCDSCLLAAELKAQLRTVATWRKGSEESGRRWELLEAHEKVKAEEYVKLEYEHAKLSAEHDDLQRRLDGIRWWLDVKDTITGDR